MIAALPKPLNSTLFVAGRQTIPDIVNLLKRGVNDSAEAAQILAPYLNKKNIRKTCYAVWLFLKNNVRYEREPAELQTIKTLPRLLMQDKKGDCKHFTTACAALFKALGIKCKLRLVSFKYYDSEPTHIYCIAYDENNEQIYVDCVIEKFDSEAAYKHKKDIKI